MINASGRVQIPLSSQVGDVRKDAAAAGRESLHFFMTAILSMPLAVETALFIQSGLVGRTVIFPRLRLKEFTADLVLWNSIQPSPLRIQVEGVSETPKLVLPEPVKWLYGTKFRIVPLVTWAPDVVFTSDASREGAFDARSL